MASILDYRLHRHPRRHDDGRLLHPDHLRSTGDLALVAREHNPLGSLGNDRDRGYCLVASRLARREPGRRASGIRVERDRCRAAAELADAAALADAETRDIVLRHASDVPLSLRDWGYEIIQTDRGTVFADTNYAKYEPTSDLVSIALRIADIIDADQYLVDRITVASDLPAVWFRGPHHDDAVAAIERMKACVSVSASPRPESGTQPLGQMFLVFIADMLNPEDAEILVEASRLENDSYSSMTVMLGTVAATVIARSFVDGVEAIEDHTTIERFREPFQAALESTPTE